MLAQSNALVPFRHSFGSRKRPDLELTGIKAGSQMADADVLGLARPGRYDGAEAGAPCGRQRVNRLGNGPGLVDLDEETRRIRSELAELTKYEQRITRNLSNENFVSRAPEEVVDRERDRLAGAQERIARLTDILDRLAG